MLSTKWNYELKIRSKINEIKLEIIRMLKLQFGFALALAQTPHMTLTGLMNSRKVHSSPATPLFYFLDPLL